VPEETVCCGLRRAALEIPSLDSYLISHALCSQCGACRFGDEFPIRFDFSTPWRGNLLSKCIHLRNTSNTIRNALHPGRKLLPAGCPPWGERLFGAQGWRGCGGYGRDLKLAQTGITRSRREYANQFPARKHDHFLIPAGTVHCSGAGSMVLEISATPYIHIQVVGLGSLGLDGKMRPINLEHGWPTYSGSHHEMDPLPSGQSVQAAGERDGCGRSTRDCTSASSSRRVGIGSQERHRTTRPAASMCSISLKARRRWWKVQRMLLTVCGSLRGNFIILRGRSLHYRPHGPSQGGIVLR